MQRNKLLIAVAIIQIIFFVSWYCLEDYKLQNPESTEITLETAPVDPRDLLSGNYFSLSYEMSNMNNFSNHHLIPTDNISKYREVYALLIKGRYNCSPHLLFFSKPRLKKNEIAIKGKLYRNSPIIEYGIEKYFLNENTQVPDTNDDIRVKLIIDKNFEARIKALIVNGRPFKH